THTHTQLRRCLAFLLFTIIPYNSFAVDACVPNDTVAVVLNTNTTNNYTYSGIQPKWITGTGIRGTSACLSGDHGIAPYWEHRGKRDFIYRGKLVENDVVVVGGERSGVYCWCKIIYPVVTYWYLILRKKSIADCVDICPGNCGWDITNEESYQATVFNSIQN
ncbi:MAG: hypothetical protein IJL05_02790, partial [Alphaproteobacteria bacterium]|nr:hypothetical protein [Alphaproteobacteria bacterium]